MIRLLVISMLCLLPVGKPRAEDTTHCFSAIYALNEGRLDEAIELYSRCLEEGNLSESNRVVAYNDRGNAYGKKGMYELALEDFNAVIALRPNDPDAWYNRGLTHKRLGRLGQALVDYSKAIELNGRYAKAYNNRGTILGEQGEFVRALADFDKAIAIDGKDASAWFNRGLAHYSLGQYEEAASDLEKAIDLNADYVKAYENLAWLRATCPDNALRDGQAALALARKARFLREEGTPGLYDILAAAHAAIGSFENAVRYQELAIESSRDSVERNAFEERLRLYREATIYREAGGNRFRASG